APPTEASTEPAAPPTAPEAPPEGGAPAESTEGEPAPEGEAEAPPPEGEPIASLDDLAKAFGVETAELTQRIQIEGPGGEKIPLANLLEAHKRLPEYFVAEGQLRARAEQLAQREAQIQQAADQGLAG